MPQTIGKEESLDPKFLLQIHCYNAMLYSQNIHLPTPYINEMIKRAID